MKQFKKFISTMFFSKKKRIYEIETLNEQLISKITELEKVNNKLITKSEKLEITIIDLGIEITNLKWELNKGNDEEDNMERCSCGGILLPMYDEYPNWIKFCSKCDARYENTDISPIAEPA